MKRFKLIALALASIGGLAGSPGASALTVVSGVSADSLTQLWVDWSWDTAGGTGVYSGTFWNAELDAVFIAGAWQVTGRTQHLAGTHGESAEGAWHSATVVFLPGTGASTGGVADHLPPTAHLGAHVWGLAANGPAPAADLPFPPPGFARQTVVHAVPEPGRWMMLGGGLLVLAAWRRRRA